MPAVDVASNQQRAHDLERQVNDPKNAAANAYFGVDTRTGNSSQQNSRAQSEHQQSENSPSRSTSGAVSSAALLATLAELGDLPTLPSLPSSKNLAEGGVPSEQMVADRSTPADTSASTHDTFETNGGTVQDISFSRSEPSSCTTMITALDGDSEQSFVQPPPVPEKPEQVPGSRIRPLPQILSPELLASRLLFASSPTFPQPTRPPPVPEKTDPIPCSRMTPLPQILSPEMLASKSPFVSAFHKIVFPDRPEYDAEEVALEEKKASMGPVLAAYLAEQPSSNHLLRVYDDRSGSAFGSARTHEVKHRTSSANLSLKVMLKPSTWSLGSTAVSSPYAGSPGKSEEFEI
ncbi:unnamed protein product [Tilletia controversa]|uniref:Uncharacterized protein n=3 Tax=Tilletia TaxID=13289 RepID=A0A8X7SWP3_9BASI|nr:hypothetical protein CF328_g4111 [Tilletia controversa]KAE8196775.1 hypothetical protein CF336_g2469 [Tilletia laevis]KAE8262876.1 hypothetical protein A4X03_0g2110 [Tilletia caries]KAE8206430.1 hypothetical protein CF335_g1897 [Tilletia laevis]KAE8246887.1 hypothetical protein A4X06_0g4839 [Tilletia controversa]